MNVIFLPLKKKETLWGILIAAIYLPVSMGLEAAVPAGRYWVVCLFSAIAAAAAVLCARRFFAETLQCLRLVGKQLIWKPLLAVLLCRVICVAVNDLALFFQLPYFVSSDWGPLLWDVRSAGLSAAAQTSLLPVLVTVIVLMPFVEEFLFRGVILGNLYQKNSVLAVMVSVILFTVFHTLPYLGVVGDPAYLCCYGFQFIPMGLFLSWLYISTDSIVPPMAAHMILNAILML